MAVWKEGSSRYLVGRLSKLKAAAAAARQSSLNGGGAKYTCYRYERQLEGGQFVIKMSQSVSGRCEGLWSAEEGDKTYTLTKGSLVALIAKKKEKTNAISPFLSCS